MPVRKPRAWLIGDGIPKMPCLNVSVSKTVTRSSDNFHVKLALSDTEQRGMDAAAWASMGKVQCSIIAAVDDMDAGQTLLTGEADKIEIDWLERVVTLSGRDKSAKLGDKRRSEKFNNQSLSDIVGRIAADAGLNAVVSDGDAITGKSYDQDEAALILGATDFETLSTLADRHGYVWYVDGDDLHFEPREVGSDVYLVRYRPPSLGQYAAANVVHLLTSRNLRAAKSVRVKVKSWHSRDNKCYVGEASSNGDGDGEVVYEHITPLLSQSQADAMASAKLRSITRHEMEVTVTAPGDLSIMAKKRLRLSGTGTIFDQDYDIDHIECSFEDHGGFTMRVKTRGAKSGREGSDPADVSANRANADAALQELHSGGGE